MLATAPDYDVLIVGAGISGIGMAAHMEMHTPNRSYAIVEMRAQLGGTWDLFRYPGVRSDSDMHTLGFVFEPWRHEKSIADAPAILQYLHRIVDERGIADKIRYRHRVVSADWRGDEARWHVVMEKDDGSRTRMTANFLYLGSGYYDYDKPYDPGFEFGDFSGQVLHPQFWPEELDYSGKKIVVIGSGATAVTIVPSMAEKAAKVTMLQRTPTWMFSSPAKDWFANILRKFLPEETAYKITRWKNIALQDFAFKTARRKPEKVKKALHKRITKSLGKDYDLADFTPPYDPWDQRLCLVPDDDLFSAMKAGKAAVVTGKIKRFVAGGIELDDGSRLDADIIVTATGLNLAVCGKIAVSVDGDAVDFSDRFYYKGCMFSNLPNFAVVFGYLNASWTLRADVNSAYICRVLNRMAETGNTIAIPVLPADHDLVEDDIFDFSSGYIKRALDIMPKSAVGYPWRLNQEYVADRKIMRDSPVEDGILRLSKTDVSAHSADARMAPAG